MDALFEYLVPVIVLVIWAVSQYLGNRNNQESEDAPPSPTEQDEETRRIQEEIRRKIAERRQQQQQESSQPAPRSSTLQQRSSTLEQRTTTPEQRTSTPPPLRPSATPTARRQQDSRFPPPLSTSTEPSFFEVPQPQRNLAAELAEQERRLRQSQRVADDARRKTQEQQARSTQARRSNFPQPSIVLPSETRAAVIAALRHPEAARQAVLFYEILGTPVGLRREGQMRPSWES